MRLLPQTPIERLYATLRGAPNSLAFVDGLLSALAVQFQVADADLARVPKTGATVVVANHPFGLLEGAVLAHVFTKVRPDVKFLANHLLAQAPEIRDFLILVDPFGEKDSVRYNRRGLREAL